MPACWASCAAPAICASIARHRRCRMRSPSSDAIGKPTASTSSRSMRRKVAELEPHLKDGIAGGVLMPDPVSVSDPGALVNGYAELFEKRGGRFVHGDARTLEQGGDLWAGRNAARAARCARRGRGARAVVRRHLPAARLPLSARHQARLSQAFQGAGQCHAQPAGARRRGRLRADADDARHPPHHRRGVCPARCAADAGPTRARRAAGAGDFPVGRRGRTESGWGGGPACPTCCRSSAGRRAIEDCGSTSATTIWASRWGRWLAGCWPR